MIKVFYTNNDPINIWLRICVSIFLIYTSPILFRTQLGGENNLSVNSNIFSWTGQT